MAECIRHRQEAGGLAHRHSSGATVSVRRACRRDEALGRQHGIGHWEAGVAAAAGDREHRGGGAVRTRLTRRDLVDEKLQDCSVSSIYSYQQTTS